MALAHDPLWLILGLAIILGGCLGSQPPAPRPAAAVTLREIDEADLAKILEAHGGRVVLVDFWATWCSSCVELFPHTVELHRRLADRGLAVVSISLDPPTRRAEALAFLEKQGATFDNYVSRHGGTSRPFEAFAIDGGALPHFKLYDRQGKLHKSFSSAGQSIDPAEIDRAIEGLLEAVDR